MALVLFADWFSRDDMSRRRGGRHPKVRMRVESSLAYPGHDSAPGTTGHGGAAGIGLQVPG